MLIVPTIMVRNTLPNGVTQTNHSGGKDTDIMKRNKYDDAYVMGYHNGYHALKYDNQYNEDAMPQYHIKYKMGYVEGKMLRTKEEREDR